MASIKKDLRGYICDDREKKWSMEYAAREISLHKKNLILDHPDGSVTTSKLADGSVTEEKIDEAIIVSINENKSEIEVLHSSLLSEISARKSADDKKADKADTLSGYGITDSYTRDEMDRELDKKADQSQLDQTVVILTGDMLNIQEEKADRDELEAKADKTAYSAFTDGETLILSDNTAYIASGAINTLTIEYPDIDFLCSLEFTTADEGDITIIFPKSKYIGEVPTFKNGETWELSIKNGIVVGGMAE